jgi:flagellar hook-associated protein 1 FlgK
MGILNIGTQALQANQVALQTIGNNIANVNTIGYSRQRVVMGTVAGQFTGAGYVGKGVDIQTIQRNYDQFLTRQSTLAASTQSSDTTRSDYLTQLSNIFQGGANGIGQSVNDMLNSMSDVASTPTDITARTVVLTRVDETTRRLRDASQSLDDLQTGITQALNEKLSTVNTLAQNIADVNGQIALAQGSGQPPNDLLDKRDQLIHDLNQYVQTTSVAADDGSVGIYIGGSQSLVLGSSASKLALSTTKDDFGDPQQNKLTVTRDGLSVTMDEKVLGGGEVSGLLRFQNNDLVESRNLLGRLTTAITTTLNTQHKLGLDLNGNAGQNLFTPVDVNNILVPVPPAATNGLPGAALQLAISDTTQFVASDYQVKVIAANQVAVTRMSDGTTRTFDPTAAPTVADPNPAEPTFDGLKLSGLASATVGDRFLLKPFGSAATNIAREFSTPSALAVASPLVGKMGANNTGSLQLTALVAKSQPTPIPPATTGPAITITFGANNTYTRSDVPAGPPIIYTSGEAITSLDPTNDWSLKLQGSPKSGDTFTVQDIKSTSLDIKLNGGNATNMMNLRDVAMFDGAAMSDGYAGLISQIGIRAQSANYSATVSTNIAINAEKDRTGIAGVNLDEEAAKLIQYQQAYQASAKMIQVAQSIFDTLIRTLGA